MSYDVLVAGGGAGGVAAALGAARSGAKVLLAERYGFLGGAATNAGVLAYCGLFERGDTAVPAVGGAADLILSEMRALGCETTPFQSRTSGNWLVMLDPEVTKLAFDRVLMAHDVTVLHHVLATSDDNLVSVTLTGLEGPQRVTARAFVDATGNAQLASSAGIPCRDGNGDGQIQALSCPIRVGGLPEGLTLDRDLLRDALADYSQTGAYPVARDNAGFIGRIPGSSDVWWMIIDHPLPAFTSHALSRAERHARAAARDYVAVLRDTHPGCGNATLLATGPQVGIRESRHPKARAQVTEHCLTEGKTHEHGIARAAWPMENHTQIGRPTFVPVGGPGFAHIPLDALRAQGHDNLYYAGRLIGADPLAYGSIRVMGTAFATGEAAGVAAAMPGSDVAAIQEKLRNSGALI